MDKCEKIFKLNTDKTIVFELNYSCNLQCIHCYVPSEEKLQRRFMNYSDAKSLLDQLQNNGFKRILITGGEPLLNPDFEKIYTYAWDMGFTISLFSNVTLMDEKIKRLLVEKKPALIRVSLFGGDIDSYEKVTGHNLYKVVYANILFLKENNVNVTVKIPLLKQNNLVAIREIQQSLAEQGISTKVEVRILPRFDGDNETVNYRYRPEEIIALGIDNQVRGLEKYKQISKQFDKKVKDINYCIHVCQPFVVNPECKLQLCFFMREWTIDLKTVPFVKALEMLIEKISNEQIENSEFECKGCDKQYMCPYCPGWAKTEVGMINKKIPFLCELVEGYENKYNALIVNKKNEVVENE